MKGLCYKRTSFPLPTRGHYSKKVGFWPLNKLSFISDHLMPVWFSSLLGWCYSKETAIYGLLSLDRVASRGPLRQPGVATTTSLRPFSTNAEGCTIADLLDPWIARASWLSAPTRTKAVASSCCCDLSLGAIECVYSVHQCPSPITSQPSASLWTQILLSINPFHLCANQLTIPLGHFVISGQYLHVICPEMFLHHLHRPTLTSPTPYLSEILVAIWVNFNTSKTALLE